MDILATVLIIIYITTEISASRISRSHDVSIDLSTEESFEVISPEDELPNTHHILRTVEGRRSWRVCFKKAGKECIKSCKRAFKAVCKRRKCTSKAKKALKKECKSNCRNEFGGKKGRDNSE